MSNAGDQNEFAKVSGSAMAGAALKSAQVLDMGEWLQLQSCRVCRKLGAMTIICKSTVRAKASNWIRRTNRKVVDAYNVHNVRCILCKLPSRHDFINFNSFLRFFKQHPSHCRHDLPTVAPSTARAAYTITIYQLTLRSMLLRLDVVHSHSRAVSVLPSRLRFQAASTFDDRRAASRRKPDEAGRDYAAEVLEAGGSVAG